MIPVTEESTSDESYDEFMNIKHLKNNNNNNNNNNNTSTEGQKRGIRTRKSSHSNYHQTVATIEVFIVADKHMVQFHGNDTIEDYVLTMMNMVSQIFVRGFLLYTVDNEY